MASAGPGRVARGSPRTRGRRPRRAPWRARRTTRSARRPRRARWSSRTPGRATDQGSAAALPLALALPLKEHAQEVRELPFVVRAGAARGRFLARANQRAERVPDEEREGLVVAP